MQTLFLTESTSVPASSAAASNSAWSESLNFACSCTDAVEPQKCQNVTICAVAVDLKSMQCNEWLSFQLLAHSTVITSWWSYSGRGTYDDVTVTFHMNIIYKVAYLISPHRTFNK